MTCRLRMAYCRSEILIFSPSSPPQQEKSTSSHWGSRAFRKTALILCSAISALGNWAACNIRSPWQMLRRSCAESMALSMVYPSIREMPPPEPLADMTGIPAMDSVLISR